MHRHQIVAINHYSMYKLHANPSLRIDVLLRTKGSFMLKLGKAFTIEKFTGTYK